MHFVSPSASTSARLGYFPVELIHTIIPEGSMPLVTIEETIPYFEHLLKACTNFWGFLPQSSRLLSLIIESSKGYSIFLSGQLLQDVGERGKTSGFYVLYFSVCEVSSLIRNNTMSNQLHHVPNLFSKNCQKLYKQSNHIACLTQLINQDNQMHFSS